MNSPAAASVLLLLRLCLLCCSLGPTLVRARDVPSSVQLGGAIVAAVEQDVEQDEALEAQHRADFARTQQQLWRLLTGEADSAEVELLLHELQAAGGRGKQQHKHKKMLKMLYPVLAGILIAKAVLLPMILKMLTALSTSSFVMGKIALISSGLLALKWILAGSDGHIARERFAVVHVPAAVKAYGPGLSLGSDWPDLSPSGSAWVDVKALHKQSQKYIPLGVATKDTEYRYPQHNYDGNAYNHAKPFL